MPASINKPTSQEKNSAMIEPSIKSSTRARYILGPYRARLGADYADAARDVALELDAAKWEACPPTASPQETSRETGYVTVARSAEQSVSPGSSVEAKPRKEE